MPEPLPCKLQLVILVSYILLPTPIPILLDEFQILILFKITLEGLLSPPNNLISTSAFLKLRTLILLSEMFSDMNWMAIAGCFLSSFPPSNFPKSSSPIAVKLLTDTFL